MAGARNNFDWLSESEADSDTEMETSDVSSEENSDETDSDGFSSYDTIQPEPLQSSVQNTANSINLRKSPLDESPAKLINDRFKCPVCLVGFDKQVTMAITCGHVLCKNCIDMLPRGTLVTCPVCRGLFRRSSAKRIFL